MKGIFCSSPTPVWKVRQPVCMVTEATILFLCSVAQSSSFHLKNLFLYFLSSLYFVWKSLHFPSALFAISLPVIHQWKFTPAPHQVCCNCLLKNCLGAVVQLWFECGCVHFWCDALLLFLLLDSIEKVFCDVYFDDVCHFNITIYLCQCPGLVHYPLLKLPADHISVCQFLSQIFYPAQGIKEM